MAYARQCDQCHEVVQPRGDVTPRYCAYCGARLSGGPVEGGSEQRVCRWAIVSFALVFVAPPMHALGLPLVASLIGVSAMICGVYAYMLIRSSQGRLVGERLAKVGMLGLAEFFLYMVMAFEW